MVGTVARSEPNQAVRRLAQYRPFDDEGQSARAALRDLLLGAAVIQGKGFESLAACRDGIRDLWDIEVEIDEIRDVVDELAAEDRAQKRRGGFQLTDATVAELEQTAAESAEVEAQAFADWETAVRAIEPDVSAEEMDTLRSDLREWLAQVIARHGVEAALLLYPENPRAVGLFQGIENMGLTFLPARTGRVGRIRDAAFQVFVKRPTPAQRTYLAGLMNTSFYMTVLTLDPEASALVQERVAGHRVYLDTNFLYALLGLSTASEAWSSARLIELTGDLGYELAVTPWTVEELRTSLRASERRLSSRPLPRRELADLMVRAAGEQGFVRGFWLA